ncbi:unnamed protein product [Rotaria magnacalcarata]|uniref:Uncharacterized protein n=1 Tax=Rotaria magnacalcarata TaxID=392030 RepID=A0A815YIF1_9BILA|nr:unnamed protein product [Rotaria magnacalcarata]CAF4202877.1 unnamed protein product [Rotaria magnacalcarata]
MKSFSINRQLITSTMKPNKESERVAAAKGIIDLIVDIDESVTNAFENLEATIKKSGLSLEGLTSIGADNTNVNMDNTHTLFHNQIKNQFKGIALTAFSRAATRVQELKSYYEFDEKDSQVRRLTWNYKKESITAIDLYRIIPSIQYKLKKRLDTSCFGIQCRNLLNRMLSDTSAELQASFKRFSLTFLEHIDKYFSQNVAFLKAIGHFG